MDVIDLALKDERDYPNRSSSGYLALKRLGDRLHHKYESVYGHEESPPALVSKKATGRTLMTPSAGRAAWSGDTVYQLGVTRRPLCRNSPVESGLLLLDPVLQEVVPLVVEVQRPDVEHRLGSRQCPPHSRLFHPILDQMATRPFRWKIFCTTRASSAMT
jgi:hypothetical protein